MCKSRRKLISGRKVLALLLCIVLNCGIAVLFTGCGKSEEVKAVEQSIDELGVITPEKESEISEVEVAFYALSEEDRKKVENADVLISARNEYEAMVEAAAIQEVEAAISAIGEVSQSSAEVIQTACDLYNALTEDQKEKVTNYQELHAACDAFDQILSDCNEVLSQMYTCLHAVEWDLEFTAEYCWNAVGVGYDTTHLQECLTDMSAIDREKLGYYFPETAEKFDVLQDDIEELIPMLDALGTTSGDRMITIIQSKSIEAVSDVGDIVKSVLEEQEFFADLHSFS